jgi:iron complex outermembrane receptor protein
MSRPIHAEACLSSNAQRRRLLAGTSGAALTLALMLPAGAALAQAPVATNANAANLPACQPGQTDTSNCKPATELQTVVVTGSRIARKDYTADSPIVTLGQQQLQQTGEVQIQNVLNRLPQFTPAQNLLGANAGDVQNTPTHSIGITTASLRGLGSNRNLVLIDGQRAAPVNGELDVDLSTIPTAMIDHIETITGGASAVYGADAIGGVVNFIMKKNFQGLDLDAQGGVSQRGDGRNFQTSVVMGTNFADGKGNVTMAIERSEQDPYLQKDHPFYTKSWNDPTVASNGFFNTGTYYNGSGVSAAAVASIFGAGSGVSPFGSFFVDNPKGLYVGIPPFGGPPNPIAGATPTVNGTTTAYQNVVSNGTVIQNIKQNETVGYIEAPFDRWSFTSNGHYDINDWVTAKFTTTFSQTHTSQLLTAPASFITGWTVNVPYNQVTDDPASPGYIAPGAPGAQHPVPAGLATLLNSRTGGATAPWLLNWLPSINGPLPPRGATVDNTVYQIRAGLEGKIPTINWSWDLEGSHSSSQEYTNSTGDYSLQRFQALITAAGYGANTQFKGNFTQPNGGQNGNGIGGSTVLSPNFGFGMGNGQHCTSGFYGILFGTGNLSSDCFQAMDANVQQMNITKQDVVEFDTSGDIYKLPAGMLKGSIGADYRRVSQLFTPDNLQSTYSFLDQVVGVYPTAPYNVSQDAKEGYGELEIPVLADLPFIKSLTINPGVRYSSYNTSAGGWTWKILADYQVNDWVRFRGGYNLAIRTPNLGELFENPQEVFGAGSSHADPCSLLSDSPYGAAGSRATVQGVTAPLAAGQTLAGAQSTYNICRALMGVANPNAATQFYDTPGVNQPPPGGSFFGFNEQSGNPNLSPETARTYTAGLVLKSPFQNPLISRLQVSFDYYRIHISDAIELASQDYTFQQCFGGQFNGNTAAGVAAALASPFCQAVQRSPNGGTLALVGTPYANLSTIDTSGLDVQFDWSATLADAFKDVPGRVNVNMVANFLGNYDTTAGPGQPVLHWYGSLGPTLVGTNPGAYAYRLNTTFGYSVGPANINLNWRFYPAVNAIGAVTSPATNSTYQTPSYSVFDLTGFFTLPHGLQLRAGIQNIADTDPAITGKTKAVSVGGVLQSIASSGQGTTAAQFYDPLGRRFFIGLKARF